MEEGRATRPLRIAALVKQIPVFEEMRLGPDGRLEREGLPLEMSAYCRRAVAQGVSLARGSGGRCTVVTLGPPAAEAVLREAIACGADDGVLITDPAFAGSDTLATARALAAAIERLEEERDAPFDLILSGRASVDADTGQVGPELAELLELPFATGVKQLRVEPTEAGFVVAQVGLEHDDAWVDATVELPAVLSTAERLIDPCKIKDPAVWATVDDSSIRRMTAADLGVGPWGQEGSPTWVGETRVEVVHRDRLRFDGPLDAQVDQAVRYLVDHGVLHRAALDATGGDAVATRHPGSTDPALVVLVEPGRAQLTRELLSGASRLAGAAAARVVVIGPGIDAGDAGDGGDGADGAGPGPATLASWGADEVVVLRGAQVEEDVAAAVVGWAAAQAPWGILAGSTAWGREVASRIAASLGAGLTGDAVGFRVEQGRLVSWKPAFGGSLVAAIRSQSPVQMATVRAGVLATSRPREPFPPPVSTIDVEPAGRVVVHDRRREDTFDRLLAADMVVGIGQGVDPAHYGELDELVEVLHAERGATRKVTDRGWMPHARQIGITGHSLAPRLYVAVGTSGKYNHMVGVRSAGVVLAINPDPGALVFDVSDIGIVGDWREVVPLLVTRLRRELAALPS